MNRKIKILCTIGPKSLKKDVISYFLKNNVDIFRINMSHTSITELRNKIKYLKKLRVKNICIDTEGAQVRTSNSRKKFLKRNTIVILNKFNSNKKGIKLYPNFNFNSIKVNSIIKIGFEGLELKVLKKTDYQINTKVIKQGVIDNNKGVHFNQKISLDSLTAKDLEAIKLGKELKIKYFALSFANSLTDVKYFRNLIGNKSFLISKIETKSGYENIKKITKNSNAILIDRGDLSRYYPVETIPIMQKLILKVAKSFRKDCYIATNLLESMIINFYPTRAESNDIFSSLESGAKGLVLAAETAIGNYPKECVDFVNKCIIKRYNFKNLKKIY